MKSITPLGIVSLISTLALLACTPVTPENACGELDKKAHKALVRNNSRKTVLLIDMSRSTRLSPNDSISTLQQNSRAVNTWLRENFNCFGDELEVFSIYDETRNGHTLAKKQRLGDNFFKKDCYRDSLDYILDRVALVTQLADSLMQNAMGPKSSNYSDIWGIIPLMARISEHVDSVTFCIISDMKEEPQPAYRSGNLCFRNMANPEQDIRREIDAGPAVAKDLPCIAAQLLERSKWSLLKGDHVQILHPQKSADPFALGRLKYWETLLEDSLHMQVETYQRQ